MQKHVFLNESKIDCYLPAISKSSRGSCIIYSNVSLTPYVINSAVVAIFSTLITEILKKMKYGKDMPVNLQISWITVHYRTMYRHYVYVCMHAVCMYGHTHTHRHTQTDRRTDRETHRQTEKHTDRERNTQTDTQTHIHTDTQTQTDRQADRQTGRQADRQTDTHTHTHIPLPVLFSVA